MAATGVGFVLVVPILLFLAALSVTFPSVAFKILGGSLLMLAFLALFSGGAQRQAPVRARAVAPAQVAPIQVDVQEEGAPAVEIIEE